MSDFNKCVLLELTVQGYTTERYTSHYTEVTYSGNTYETMQAMEISSAVSTSNIEFAECAISGLEPVNEIALGLFYHVPYTSVSAKILQCDIDPTTDIATNPIHVYDGPIYTVSPNMVSGYMSVECRDRKYYTDITAGSPCTEQCGAPEFGDSKICQKSVTAKQFTINDISGNNVTVADTVTDPAGVFNKGYLEYEGVRITVRYWSTGSTFQLKRPAPANWLGQAVLFYYGCDRSLSSCRNIHNNETRFWGTGYGMLDYDPKYSSA